MQLTKVRASFKPEHKTEPEDYDHLDRLFGEDYLKIPKNRVVEKKKINPFPKQTASHGERHRLQKEKHSFAK